MKYCNGCGTQIPTENIFCPNCGFKQIKTTLPNGKSIKIKPVKTPKELEIKVVQDEIFDEEIPASNTKKYLALIAAGVLLAVAFYLVFIEDNNKDDLSNSNLNSSTKSEKSSALNQLSSTGDPQIDSTSSESINRVENSEVVKFFPNNALELLTKYTSSISAGDYDELDQIFAENVVKFHSASNISPNGIKQEAKNYLKKWTIVAEDFETMEQVSDRHFSFQKAYSIRRNKDGKQLNYRISGYVILGEDGKIIELVDSNTQKINN